MRKNQRVLTGVLITLVLLSVFSVSPVYAKTHRRGSKKYDETEEKVVVTRFKWIFKIGGRKYNNQLKVRGTIRTKNADSPIFVELKVVQIDPPTGTTWTQVKEYDPARKINFGFKWWDFPELWFRGTVTVTYEGKAVWSESFIFDPPGGGPGPMY